MRLARTRKASLTRCRAAALVRNSRPRGAADGGHEHPCYHPGAHRGSRAILTAVVLGALVCGGCDRAAERETRVEPPGKVLVLGLDGADWTMLDRLAAEGRIPHLARLAEEGARGTLRSENPLLSPILWTTIATGRTPVDHGILGFLTVRDGKTEPVRSDERAVRAFWNVASDHGLTSGVVGWYASWPAEPVDGFLVSDRVGQHQIAGDGARARTGLTWPEALSSEIEGIRDEVDGEVDRDALARYFGAVPASGAPSIEPERLDTFLGILRTTELYRRLTPTLLERHDPAIAAVYFEGTDAVGHLFAEYVAPPLDGITAEESRYFGPALDRYYSEVDSIVGEFLARIDPEETTVVVISDHGFKSGEKRPRRPTRSEGVDQAPLWHRDEGMVLLWGRGIRGGVALPEASIYDVFPTVMRLVGVPLSEELEGRPIEAAFTDELLAEPVRSIASYESGGARDTVSDAEAGDDEVLAKLRALGYVGGAGGDAGAGAGATGGQAAIPLNRYNLGLVLLNRDRDAEALEVFRELQNVAPEFPLGYLGEGVVHVRGARPEDAVRTLERAVALGSEYGAIHAALGEARVAVGRTREAIPAFRKALEIDSSDGRTALLLGSALARYGRRREAVPFFRAATVHAAKAIDRAEAHVGLAIAAEDARDLAAAEGAYRAALAEVPELPRALERFANLALFRGDRPGAIELYRRLTVAEAGSPGAWTLYGRALAIDGRAADAVAALERAVAIDPGHADAVALLRQLGSGGRAGG